MGILKKNTAAELALIPGENPEASTGKGLCWNNSSESIFSKETRIEGNIFSSEPIQVFGTVEGNIQSAAEIECDGSRITGNVHGSVVRVSGGTVIKGDIHGDEHVIISESTQVEGNIVSAQVTLNGSVVGNVTTGGKTTFGASCTVSGNVETKELEICSGASLNGNMKMVSSSPTPPALQHAGEEQRDEAAIY